MAGFIKFDGVDGESEDKDHGKWSNMINFSQLIHKAGAGTGSTRRRGDVVLEDIVIVKELDKSSTKLAESVCKGKVYPKVEIHVTAAYTDAGAVTYYAYELKNVQIASYNISGNTARGGDGAPPVENMTLNFEEIKVTYTECDKGGKKKAPEPVEEEEEQGFGGLFD